MNSTKYVTTFVLGFAVSIAGCGGGGSNSAGGVSLATPTGTVFVPLEVSSEYQPVYSIRVRNAAGVTVIGTFTDSHLRRINAAAAYGRGATGAGETIAIVDTGIRDSHREFSRMGKVTKVTEASYTPTDAESSHGTFVAALAVGERDGRSGLNIHGVAFNANVHFTEISLGGSGGTYHPFRLAGHSADDDRNLAAQFGRYIASAQSAGAAIINQSFGVNGAISVYAQQEVLSLFMHTAATLAQENTVDADKTIIVWAAGNAGSGRLQNGGQAPFGSPEIWQGLGAYFPELRSHVLAVVALDQNGDIASYSNRCGIAQSFCLAAPGSRVLSASSRGDNKYRVYSGTSFAAPLVSGSLALLRQYFRGQLGNTELVSRLLVTANREGIYADSNIYGRGLVDLDAATAPVGAMMTGLPGDPASRPFAGSGIALSSGAFGASLQGALANMEVAGFDALGAPFFQSAATWVAQPAHKRRGTWRKTRKLPLSAPARHTQNSGVSWSLALAENGTIADARLSFADGWWVSYGQHGGQSFGLYGQSFVSANGHDASGVAERFNAPLAFAAPYLSLVRDGPGIGWSSRLSSGGIRFGFALMHGAPQFDEQHNPGGRRGAGVLFNMSINRAQQVGTGLALQVGAVSESDGFLGARLQGAFGKASATTAFAGINGAWALDNNDDWHLLMAAYLGHTQPQVDSNSLLYDASPIVSSAFSIGAARASTWRAGDWLSLRLSQPLRVESGNVKLRIPAGRTKYGQVVYKNHDVNLTPAARAVHAEAIYRFPLAGGVLETSMGMERHLQHSDRARSFMRLYFEWRL